MKEPRGERLDLRRVRVLVRQRLRQGRRRARAAFWPVVTAAVAAGLAWAVAFYALGHVEPFFAPVAAWVCLGFNADRQVRKVAELAIGVTLGVGFGELVASLIGTGVPQIMLVIVVAALMARFVDRGHTLTIQAGVQGVVIVALPVVATDGATGRWTDALVGGAFALLVGASVHRPVAPSVMDRCPGRGRLRAAGRCPHPGRRAAPGAAAGQRQLQRPGPDARHIGRRHR